jgi:hypothetical protein
LLVRAELAVTEDAMKELGEGLGLLKRGHCLRSSSHGPMRTTGVGMCRVWHPPPPPPGDFWPQSILLRWVKGGLVAVRWGGFGPGPMAPAGICRAVRTPAGKERLPGTPPLALFVEGLVVVWVGLI